MNENFDIVCSNCGAPLEDSNRVNPAYAAANFKPVKTNGFAIASMVLGILGVVLTCCCTIFGVLGILAVIFGFIAKKDIRESFGEQKGDGMAVAGIILGFVTIGLIILSIVLSIAGITSFNERQIQEFLKELQGETYYY